MVKHGVGDHLHARTGRLDNLMSRLATDVQSPTFADGMAKLRTDIARPDLEYLWEQFGASWAVNGQLNMTAYQTSTDFLYETGTFNDAPRIDAKGWADTQFVDAVLKR